MLDYSIIGIICFIIGMVIVGYHYRIDDLDFEGMVASIVLLLFGAVFWPIAVGLACIFGISYLLSLIVARISK